MNTIGKRLKDLMKMRDIREVELAKRAGVAQSTLSRILNAKASPTHRILMKIAEALGIPTEALTIKEHMMALIILELSRVPSAELGRYYDLVRKEKLWSEETSSPATTPRAYHPHPRK